MKDPGAERGPPQPKFILRGHKTQVYATAFCRRNERLLTGDADGFVVVWDLSIMRPRAVWRPHTKPILRVAGWGNDMIITHGRDHKLIVWKLGLQDEEALSKTLPLDASSEPPPQPWMLHMLEVNTMNFCAFASCLGEEADPEGIAELLIAVPNTLTTEAIDIFHLPSQARLHTFTPPSEKAGMVMALRLLLHPLTLLAGYENGLALVAIQSPDTHAWTVTYRAQFHIQPVLGLDVSTARDSFFTCSADDLIVKHPIPSPTAKKVTEPLQTLHTRHAGQQGLAVRSDGRVFATAGWDAKVRVYSAKTLNEVAVLKWHHQACQAVSFAELEGQGEAEPVPVPGGETSDTGKDALEKAGTHIQVSTVAVPKLTEMSVKDRRLIQAKTAHWLAVGSKDGKVSLWDIF